ncbi:MAG: hypothetical protein IKQ91_08145, partial [Oscillospiraceae bacterium]|nr:hypothetical protein [Oscillospiraceae bacterium]
MALISAICPLCGGQTQIEDSRDALCPYCGTPLNQISADQGFAFAPQPDVQFAPQDMQFAQPPVQQMPMQMQQPAVMPAPQMQQGQMIAPQPQYTQGQLLEAQKQRKNWHILNTALIGAQTLMMALGILFTVKGFRIGIPL